MTRFIDHITACIVALILGIALTVVLFMSLGVQWEDFK